MIVVYILIGLSFLMSTVFTLFSLTVIVCGWFGMRIEMDVERHDRSEITNSKTKKKKASYSTSINKSNCENVVYNDNKDEPISYPRPLTEDQKNMDLSAFTAGNDEDFDDLNARLRALGI